MTNSTYVVCVRLYSSALLYEVLKVVENYNFSHMENLTASLEDVFGHGESNGVIKHLHAKLTYEVLI